MEASEETFVVVIGQEKITVPRKVTSMSQFLHNILSLGFEEEQISIQNDMISKQIFLHFLEFCEINNYEQPKIPRPITTNLLEEVLNEKNLAFIKKFPFEGSEFKELVKAASFLGAKPLLSIAAAPVACLLYFEDSKVAFDKKCKELKIEEKVQFEDEEKFKKLYPFMNIELIVEENSICK